MAISCLKHYIRNDFYRKTVIFSCEELIQLKYRNAIVTI